MALTEKLTAIADAIRGKTGSTDKLTLDSMVTEIGNISGSGGDSVVNISESESPTKDMVLTDFSQLGAISFPEATSIGSRAFWSCTALTSISLPVAKSIEVNAFYGCTALTSISLPVATTIGLSAFYGCTALTAVDLPVAKTIGEYAFEDCTNLTALILRKADSLCAIPLSAIFGSGILTAEGEPTGTGFIYVPAALYEDYVANLVTQATEEYVARAVLRKIEDYPEITG